MKKSIVITGGTDGAGKYAASILSSNYLIILLARNREKADLVTKEILKKNSEAEISIEYCDLASLQSVAHAIKNLHEKYPNIQVLINNAACIPRKRETTRDGFEMQFQVNYLSHALLTLELLPLLQKNIPSRVIFTSSMVHENADIDINDLQSLKNYEPTRTYAMTKLAMVLFSRYLSTKIKSGITFNSLHPGVLQTNVLADYMGIPRSSIHSHSLMGEHPIEGGKRIAYLTTSPEGEKYTGQYFKNNKIATPSPLIKDKELLEKLFKKTVDLLKPYLYHFHSFNPNDQ